MSAKYLGFVCFIYDLICPMECREMNGLLFLCNLSALTFSIFRGVGGRPGGTQKAERAANKSLPVTHFNLQIKGETTKRKWWLDWLGVLAYVTQK